MYIRVNLSSLTVFGLNNYELRNGFAIGKSRDTEF